MAEPTAPQAVRLAELIAVLSLGADLGLGQPMEHVLRQCLIALRLAELAGLDGQDREALYYGSLLAWVGCHVDAYEQAKWFGDDMALKRDYRLTDFASPTAGPLYLLRHVGAGRPVHERLQVGAGFLHEGMQAAGAMLDNHWRAAAGLMDQLGLEQRVRDTVQQSFERWDGKGPGGLRGEQLLVTSRLVTLADVVEVFHRVEGVDAAVAVARQRSGTQFDPGLVELFAAEAPSLFADLDAAGSWDAVIAAEPALQVGLADE
ncbi:MAG TPA: LuxR family transcriptional regulator, partial [Candidatus Binatia bacterium]|nr:LuxR family transcriptional regulator [Candidatus Binatia bacterium]